MSETVNDRVNVNLGGADGMAALAPMMAMQGNQQNNLWPIILLALLGRGGGGLLGGGSDGNPLQQQMNANAILQSLGNIQAAVPLAESQIQAALAGAVSDINSQTQAQTLQLFNQNFQGQIATQAGFAANQRDILTSACDVKTAVGNDGDRTRALITQINNDNLNRTITTLANEVTELRNENRRSAGESGIRIDMVQNQAQLQAQQQAQANALAGITHLLADNVQLARATQQAINIGGTQLASPTNTATNVRA